MMRYRGRVHWMGVMATGCAVVAQLPLARAQDEDWRRMLKASEAEQATWVRAYLGRGMPVKDPDSGTMTMLVLNRSAVTLPLIETKIEQVLRSPSPADCFTAESVDPGKFVALAAYMIAYAGDQQALREASKLLKLDRKRFGSLVQRTLDEALTRRNAFTVAYRGFELGDATLDQKIAEWAQAELADKRPPLRNYGPRDPEPKPDFEIQQACRLWAEAMVEKYGGVPTERDWSDDPIVRRLEPAQGATLHDPVIRAASVALEKRLPRQ